MVDSTDNSNSLPLVDIAQGVAPPQDARPRMEEPPPVSLIAVNDVVLPATRGLEHLLDDFYITLLDLLKESDGENLTYRADNFCIRFQWQEGLIERLSLRPVGIEIQSLDVFQRKLTDLQIEFQYQQGIVPGTQSIHLPDPAGNLVQIYERRIIG